MKRRPGRAQRPYLRQKINLYFDEHFPAEVIDELKQDKYWKNRCRIYSVYDSGNKGKDDVFQFEFCKSKGYTFVTLDTGFMNDTKYPFAGMPGIITIVAARNDPEKIRSCLMVIVDFLSKFPLPKYFLTDMKCQVSIEHCIIRGRDAETGEIKICTLTAGDTIDKVREVFNW